MGADSKFKFNVSLFIAAGIKIECVRQLLENVSRMAGETESNFSLQLNGLEKLLGLRFVCTGPGKYWYSAKGVCSNNVHCRCLMDKVMFVRNSWKNRGSYMGPFLDETFCVKDSIRMIYLFPNIETASLITNPIRLIYFTFQGPHTVPLQDMIIINVSCQRRFNAADF